jgi:NAD(P)-dependent dehydrogenase (short-subunit alcohol dehydrogenase family)
MEIAGRTFLVTGGSSGLGAATARLLEGEGANVVVADLQPGEAGSGRFVETDVLDEASVQHAVDAAVREPGEPGLHGVVNCAGIGGAALVVDREGVPLPLDAFRRFVEVNLVGTFNVIRLAAAAMAGNEPTPEGERGVIVNTASNAAYDGQIGQAAYSASKGGVVSLTLPVARELARHGIRVMAIAPGPADTPMLARLRDDVRASLESQVPFPPRLGRPEEYAALVKHIVENAYLNGEVIRLDGALRMGPR